MQGTGTSQGSLRGCQQCLWVETLGLQSWQERQEKYRRSGQGSAGSRRCGSGMHGSADAAEGALAGGWEGFREGMDSGSRWIRRGDGYGEGSGAAGAVWRQEEERSVCRSIANCERAGREIRGVQGRLSPLRGCLVAAGARGTGAGEFEASMQHTGPAAAQGR